jgi:hypothetical protein
MMLTLTLAAGLWAAPAPQELQKGWIVELHGYTYHRQVKPKLWVVEIRGYTYHAQAVPSRWIVEVPGFVKHSQAEPKRWIIEPVEAIYVDDLAEFFKQLKRQKP